MELKKLEELVNQTQATVKEARPEQDNNAFLFIGTSNGEDLRGFCIGDNQTLTQALIGISEENVAIEAAIVNAGEAILKKKFGILWPGS